MEGYEKGSRGYKVWNPVVQKIFVTRDVVFDEEGSYFQMDEEICCETPTLKL